MPAGSRDSGNAVDDSLMQSVVTPRNVFADAASSPASVMTVGSAMCIHDWTQNPRDIRGYSTNVCCPSVQENYAEMWGYGRA